MFKGRASSTEGGGNGWLLLSGLFSYKLRYMASIISLSYVHFGFFYCEETGQLVLWLFFSFSSLGSQIIKAISLENEG